jgi:hypothetical protein
VSPFLFLSIVTDFPTVVNPYPAAYSDFYGMPSAPRCVYKSGPAWPVRQGLEAQRFIREARPVHGHPITDSWLDLGDKIYKLLDAHGVMWTSIDPVAFANAGENIPFCPLLMWIGVKHQMLHFDDAVVAADAIKGVLGAAGFSDIEVAFRESKVTRCVTGPRLLPFVPLVDPTATSRKPFTPTLGLSIALLSHPSAEGTGALYFRLAEGDNRVVLLTVAHVARPPSMYHNVGILHQSTTGSQEREKIVALGDTGFENAKNAIMDTVNSLTADIKKWESEIAELGEFVDGEEPAVTKKRDKNQRDVLEATTTIESLNKFYREVNEHWANPVQRTIGCVLHADPILPGDMPNVFTRDWAFIELDNEKIDWNSFSGNKIHIGMFPYLFAVLADHIPQVATSRHLISPSSCTQSSRTGQTIHIQTVAFFKSLV